MKKRFFLTVLSCAMLLGATAYGHTHTAAGDWNADLENHWQLSEDGEQLNPEMHTLAENICTVCNAEIISFGDSGTELRMYNEYQDCTKLIFYSTDGSIESEERFAYIYDDNGNLITETQYQDELLLCERTYAVNTQGERYCTSEIYYWEAGSSSITKYDDQSRCIYSSYISADESPDYSNVYTYNEEGTWMVQKEYSGDMLTAEYEYAIEEDCQNLIKMITYNEDGSWVGTEFDLYQNEIIEIHTDAEGNVELDRRYEHTYDVEGNKTLTKTYDNGVLVEETEYVIGSNEYGTWIQSGKSTAYHEDGTKTVTDSDLDSTWSTEITYDADGNVIEEIRYEYEYDENGNSIASRGYKNGTLFVETQGLKDENGESTGILWTDYHEDGTKTVSEYDVYFELIKETVYDADGNVLSES